METLHINLTKGSTPAPHSSAENFHKMPLRSYTYNNKTYKLLRAYLVKMLNRSCHYTLYQLKKHTHEQNNVPIKSKKWTY